MSLTIVAKADKIDLVKAELTKLTAATRSEKGCVRYDVHQDNGGPAHFLCYESWGSRTIWQTHMNAPHLEAYLAATEGAVENFTLNEMTMIG